MDKNKQTPIALHYGADGIEVINDPKRAREVLRAENVDVWGVEGLDSAEVGGGDFEVPFHPGRDYEWGPVRSAAAREWKDLQAAGLKLRSSMFMGLDEHVYNDLDLLWNVSESRGAKGARWLFDAAPNLYIAQETIKITGEILEEEFVPLSARSLLPSVTHNTWLDVYRYDRKSVKMNGIAMPTSLGGFTERGVSKASSVSRTPVFKTLEFLESGASWEWFELERHSEARANGAPAFDIVGEELRMAQQKQEYVYNFATYFSFPQTAIKGLIPTLVELGRSADASPAGGLGAGTVEEDLAIFVDNFVEMRNASIGIERPDTIALGPKAWVYINTTDYKTTDAGMNESLAEAIMRQLGPLGLRDLIEVPEMDYNPEQNTSWLDETGLPAGLAEDWSGGLDQENIMLMFAKNPTVGRMNIGKPIGARPQQTIGDRTTVRYLQSLGEYDVRREKAYRLVTNVGPVP